VGVAVACTVALGSVLCWGTGAVGNGGSPAVTFRPVPVTGLTEVAGISVAHESACAIATGKVSCWGSNTSGQVGNHGAVDALQAERIIRILSA
jgi:alpha-tubulin suppressor-like RCC1 family protein